MNSTPILLAGFTLALPLGAALLLAVLAPVRRRGWPAAAVSLLAAVGSLGCAVALLVRQLEHPAHVDAATVSWLRAAGHTLAWLGVRVDGISTSMLVVVTFVATCVQIFSVGYMHDEEAPAFGRYFTYHSLFLASMNILVVAPDLLQLFLGWELVGVTSYLLIGFYFRKASAARAAVKAFWVTKFADIGLLVGLLVLRSHAGSFDWDPSIGVQAANLVTLLLFLAVMGKSAQFPLHIWLPDAMEGPTPVSALLHAATMVAAGVFLVARAWPLFAIAESTRTVMLHVGAFTALFAALVALVQTDLKKVLAYSTCSQLGYMIAALGAGSLTGGFFHLTTHAFFKALLFLSAGSVIHAVHSNEMADMGGLAKRMPLTAGVFVLGTLSLAGVPGLSGFYSKDLVLEAVAEHGTPVATVALLGGTFLTAFYMGRVLVLVFLGPPSHAAEHAHESGGWLVGPLLLLGVPSLAAGWVASSFASLYGRSYHFHFGGVGAVAAGLALGGLALSWIVYRGHRSVPSALAGYARWVDYGVMDKLYEFGFRSVAMPFARIVGWVDRYVVDGVINLSGWLTLTAAARARRLQTGVVNDYVVAVVVGAVALAAWGVTR